MTKSLLGLLLVTLISEAITENLFQPGEDYTYQYKAIIQDGVIKPRHSFSQWNLDCLLQVHGNVTEAMVKLSDCTISLYNGFADDEKQNSLNATPIPDEARQLENSFFIHYTEGYAQSIGITSEEQLWSVNIKRALASVLQIDLSKLQGSLATTMENTLHGKSMVEYHIKNDEESVTVRKFIDHQNQLSSNDFPSIFWLNIPPLICTSQTKTTTSSSEWTYSLVKTNLGHYKLTSIAAVGTVTVQPFLPEGELQYIFVNQTFVLEPKTTSYQLNSANTFKTLGLKFEISNLDPSQERDKPTKEDILENLNKLLDRLSESMEKSPGNLSLDQLHQDHVPDILYFLSLLNKDDLESYYSQLAIGTSYQQETQRNFLLELLPKVGTQASILFIRDIVQNCRVKEETAVKLLTNFPFYVRHPSEELLAECEALLALSDDKCEKIKHTAVLSFSNLIFMTCPQKCSPAKHELYIRQFVDLFTSSKTYEEQMLYLEALNNIESGNTFQYILPIIKGNVTILSQEPHHIRFLAVWASMNTAPFHPVEVYEIYWPILSNRSEHLEMRVAAFTMLAISGASPGRFLSLFWFMQSESNIHLKNFFHSTIKSLVDSQYPCYSYLRPLASLIVQYVKPPPKQNWYTGNYIIDYSDPKHGYGGLAQLFAVANERTGGPNVFYLLLINHAMGRVINNIAVYMKLERVEESVKKELVKVDPTTLSFSKLSKILKKLKPSGDLKRPVHIEIIVKNYGRIIFCKYINDTTFHNQLDSWLPLLKSIYPSWHHEANEKSEVSVGSNYGFFNQEFHINYQNAETPVFLQSGQPTDLGTPALFYLDSATLLSFRGNFTKNAEVAFTRKNQLDLWYSSTLRASLISYNPISNLWHIVRRYLTYQLHVPINNWISVNPNQGTLKFGIMKPAGTVASIVAHLRRVILIRGQNSKEMLQLSCPTCEITEDVLQNVRGSGQGILVSKSNSITGLHLQAALHHCDESNVQNPWNLLKGTKIQKRSYRPILLGTPVLAIMSYINDIIYLSTCSCGVRIELSSTESSETEFEVSLRLSKEEAKGPAESRTVLRATLANKFSQGHGNNFTIPNQWDINAVLEHIPQSSKYEIKTKMTHTVMDKKEEKLCVDGDITTPANEKHRLLNVSPSGPIIGHLNLYWGAFDGPKCPKHGITLKLTARGELLEKQHQEATRLDTWPHNKCSVESKESGAEWGKQTPLTEACYRSSVAAGTLRKYTITLKHSNAPQEVLDLGNKILSTFKNEDQGTSAMNDSPVTAVLEVPEGPEPNVRTQINGKEGIVRDMKHLIEPWLINTHFPLGEQLGLKLGMINSCVMKTGVVSTFDNATNNYSLSECYILAAGDCSEHRFAVFIKQVQGPRPLAVKIYTGENYAEIMPSSPDNVKINVNGMSIASKTLQYRYPPDTPNPDFIVMQHENGLVEVNAVLSKSWLQYNGHFIVIGTTDIYNGQTCGLCGDLNGDPSNDFSESLSTSCEEI